MWGGVEIGKIGQASHGLLTEYFQRWSKLSNISLVDQFELFMSELCIV